MTAKAKTWIALTKFDAPMQPSESSAAEKRYDVGAQQLAAGLVAAAAVIASLY